MGVRLDAATPPCRPGLCRLFSRALYRLSYRGCVVPVFDFLQYMKEWRGDKEGVGCARRALLRPFSCRPPPVVDRRPPRAGLDRCRRGRGARRGRGGQWKGRAERAPRPAAPSLSLQRAAPRRALESGAGRGRRCKRWRAVGFQTGGEKNTNRNQMDIPLEAPTKLFPCPALPLPAPPPPRRLPATVPPSFLCIVGGAATRQPQNRSLPLVFSCRRFAARDAADHRRRNGRARQLGGEHEAGLAGVAA